MTIRKFKNEVWTQKLQYYTREDQIRRKTKDNDHKKKCLLRNKGENKEKFRNYIDSNNNKREMDNY